MPPTNLAELLQDAAKQEQARHAKEIADAQEKLVTFSYDKAATYTSVIIFGGYAGFFAIWQLTKEYFSKQQALWAALLILVSLFSFIAFEVTKMIIVTRQVQVKARLLRDPSNLKTPQHIVKALQELEAIQRGRLGQFLIFWAISVFLSVAGAASGAVILGYAFISGLAK